MQRSGRSSTRRSARLVRSFRGYGAYASITRLVDAGVSGPVSSLSIRLKPRALLRNSNEWSVAWPECAGAISWQVWHTKREREPELLAPSHPQRLAECMGRGFLCGLDPPFLT